MNPFPRRAVRFSAAAFLALTGAILGGAVSAASAAECNYLWIIGNRLTPIAHDGDGRLTREDLGQYLEDARRLSGDTSGRDSMGCTPEETLKSLKAAYKQAAVAHLARAIHACKLGALEDDVLAAARDTKIDGDLLSAALGRESATIRSVAHTSFFGGDKASGSSFEYVDDKREECKSSAKWINKKLGGNSCPDELCAEITRRCGGIPTDRSPSLCLDKKQEQKEKGCVCD